MVRLVITEKPSVARAYADALGVKEVKDGYIEGNGYIISWCVGHLVELAQPDASLMRRSSVICRGVRAWKDSGRI